MVGSLEFIPPNFQRRARDLFVIWVLLLIAAIITTLQFRSLKLMMPDTLAGRIAQTALLALLLMPWAIQQWRVLRPAKGRGARWKSHDYLVAAILWGVTSCSGMVMLSCRESGTSLLNIVMTSLLGLLVILTAVLLAVRAAVGIVAAFRPWAWEAEPMIASITCFVVTLLTLWSTFRSPAVQDVDLHVNGLPAAAVGYRLCMLSDLHAGPIAGASALRRIADQVLASSCSAVVLNGDIAEGTVEERASIARELLRLKDLPDGAYYVPGNHEYYNFRIGAAHGAQEWNSWWDKSGITSLNNSNIALPRNSDQKWFVLAGVDDQEGTPEMEKALQNRKAPIILASHRPYPNADTVGSYDVAAQVSGHTHGGQFWPLHGPTDMKSGQYLSGLYRSGDVEIYVSDGTIGTYATPIRLLTQAEITRFNLQQGQRHFNPPFRQAKFGVFLTWLFMALLVASITVTCVAKGAGLGRAEPYDRLSDLEQAG